MREKVDITDAQVTALVEVNGRICLVKTEKEKYEAISFLVKQSAHELIKTGVTQDELNKFLMPSWFDD